jgi:Rifampin ADP-ribosyl transferase
MARMKCLAQTSTGYEERDEEVSGPFYHGNRARLRPGTLLTIGRKTSSWGDEGPRSQFIHFTDDLGTAQTYAAAQPRGYVYEVEPTGDIRPGYIGCEYKSVHPLRVVRAVTNPEGNE